MVARADILAGRAVILVSLQDQVDAGLRTLRSKLRTFSNSFSELGGDLFRGGLVGTVASIFPVKEFVNFQDQLLFLQTKLQITDEAMKPLEGTIRQLGMTTSFSSKEVADAATMFAQAGFSAKEVTDSLQASLDLARGGQIDLTTSTTILANALRTFGKDASFADEFASKFITSARLGTLDLVDLGESLKYSSGSFATLGVEIEEVLGLITNLSQSGLKASLGGTSLNTAFLNLSSKAEQLREILGVVLTEEDFSTPLLGLTKIQKALEKFPKLERLGIVQQLVNIRGGRAIFGTFLAGLDNLEKVTNQIRNSADEARASATKLDSRLGGVGRRALSAFQELNIAIGATSEGPLTAFGERLTKIMNDMSRLSQVNPEFVQTLLLIGPASLAAGAGLLALSMIGSKLIMVLSPLITLNGLLFSGLSKIVGGNMKALGGVGSSISTALVRARKAGAGNGALNADLHPILAMKKVFMGLDLVIGKLVVGLTRLSQLMSSGFTRSIPVFKAIHNFLLLPRGVALLAIGNFFKSFKGVSIIPALTRMGTLFTLLTVKGMNAAGALKSIMFSLGRGIGSVNWLRVFITGWKSLTSILWGTFRVLNGIRRVVFSFSGILTIVELLILFGDRIPGISNVLEGAGKAFSNLFTNIGRTLGATGPALREFWEGIKQVFGGESEQGAERISKSLSNIYHIVARGLTSAWKEFVSDIQPAVDLVHNLYLGVKGILDAIVEIAGTAIGSIFQNGKLLIAADGSLADTIANAFSPENLQGFFAAIIAVIGEIGKFINLLISKVFEVLNLLKSGFMGILQVLTSIPGKTGSDAEAALDAADPRRRFLRNRMKEVEAGNSPNKAELLWWLQDSLNNLEPAVDSFAYNLEQNNARIDAAISRFIDTLNRMGRTAPQLNTPEEDAAWTEAFENALNPNGVKPANPLADAEQEFAQQMEMRIPTEAEAGANFWKEEGLRIFDAWKNQIPTEMPKLPNGLEEYGIDDPNAELAAAIDAAFGEVSPAAKAMNAVRARMDAMVNADLRGEAFAGEGGPMALKQKQIQGLGFTLGNEVSKALVGGLGATQGSLLQSTKMEKLVEKTNALIDEGNDELAQINTYLSSPVAFT